MPKLVFIREGHDQTVKAQIWHMNDKEYQTELQSVERKTREVLKAVDITQTESDCYPIQYLEFKYGKEFLGLKT